MSEVVSIFKLGGSAAMAVPVALAAAAACSTNAAFCCVTWSICAIATLTCSMPSLCSALVEQAAAAAESMQEQAARLSEVVSVFKLGGSAAMAAPVALAGAPRKALVAAAPKKPAKPAKQVANGDEWETF